MAILDVKGNAFCILAGFAGPWPITYFGTTSLRASRIVTSHKLWIKTALRLEGMKAAAHIIVHFNQSLEGVSLPASLQTLTFGRHFNQSLKGDWLPASLQALRFGYKFNQSLQGVN
ncbi:unnamed protein product [Polarella glacialis]|uniref:Uncharacterized protein n=1 Tax=Polarella glacialis TaxID=89957 RepID=A0A813F5Z7_POLGL|nr:unnamed protein product [Polarella glacialis]CAE8644428.1 unnamed protein product [Polarella glacialis]CAE8693494.1 unnamed protein product [Polarella glacialis]